MPPDILQIVPERPDWEVSVEIRAMGDRMSWNPGRGALNWCYRMQERELAYWGLNCKKPHIYQLIEK